MVGASRFSEKISFVSRWSTMQEAQRGKHILHFWLRHRQSTYINFGYYVVFGSRFKMRWYIKRCSFGSLVDFRSCVLGQFKIGFCVHIDFLIILNSFWSWVKSNSVTRSYKYRIIGSILHTSVYKSKNTNKRKHMPGYTKRYISKFS